MAQTSYPYEPEIRAAAAKHDIPADILAALINVESSFNPNAKDYVNGTHLGLGQLGAAATKDVGGDLDKRLDPVHNIEYTAAYLKQKIDEAGNIYDGLRAYNQGGAAARSNRRTGADYADKVIKTSQTINAFNSGVKAAKENPSTLQKTIDFFKEGILGTGKVGEARQRAKDMTPDNIKKYIPEMPSVETASKNIILYGITIAAIVGLAILGLYIMASGTSAGKIINIARAVK